MKTSDEFLSMVNEFLANLPYDRKPYSLYEPVKYVLSLGGKRIRPVLMLLGYNIFKEDPEKILMNAIALETYHNYTLLHDDNEEERAKLPSNPEMNAIMNTLAISAK